MKKIIQFLLIIMVGLIFSACSGAGDKNVQEKTSQKNESADYLPSMLDTKKQAEQNIQNSINQENNNLNNAMNDNLQTGPGDNSELVKKYGAAIIKTSLGDIKVKFSSESAPVTVGNFLKLAQSGFYDNTKFHRVIKGFMIQGGDPLSKDDSAKNMWGTGGPGYKFNDELRGNEKYSQGILAMANSGPNTNGSQFFIVTADPETQLPASYTIFGQVISGMDVATKIENAKTDANDRPIDDVTIKSIEVLEK